jgi:hypothetical protein
MRDLLIIGKIRLGSGVSPILSLHRLTVVLSMVKSDPHAIIFEFGGSLRADQVPKPAVHVALRQSTHLADLKRVRSIGFEESRRSEKLDRRRSHQIEKGGIF